MYDVEQVNIRGLKGGKHCIWAHQTVAPSWALMVELKDALIETESAASLGWAAVKPFWKPGEEAMIYPLQPPPFPAFFLTAAMGVMRVC